MNSIKQHFRQIKKLPTWFFWFPAALMKFYYICFFRHRLIDPNNLCENPEQIVGITWHNRLMFICPAFPRRIMRNTSAVISASRDGQYLADFLSFFGAKALRGSSSRKGAHALRGTIHAIESGRNVVFTPDGPRGPKYQMSRGPIHLASNYGAKITPISINASRYWSMKSWDGFQIPKPFSTLTVVIGTPIAVPPDLDDAGLEEWRQKIEKALMDITID